MKEVLDPGHKYKLLMLDTEKVLTFVPLEQVLTFVKRFDPNDPSRFPGNTNAHPGTTLQSVIRCLIERVDYLQNQIPHENNIEVRHRLQECLWFLEDRAAERHGYLFTLAPEEVEQMPMCDHCGHVVCPELGNANIKSPKL